MAAFSVDINAETAKGRHNGTFADSDFSGGNIRFYMKGKESRRRIFFKNSASSGASAHKPITATFFASFRGKSCFLSLTSVTALCEILVLSSLIPSIGASLNFFLSPIRPSFSFIASILSTASSRRLSGISPDKIAFSKAGVKKFQFPVRKSHHSIPPQKKKKTGALTDYVKYKMQFLSRSIKTM